MKKPKSKLLTELDEAQQAQLADWLLSGMPYHQARELVSKEFGVSVALSSFTSFWQECCAPELIRRRSRAKETADSIAAEASRQPGKFDAATIDALKQKAFELATSPGADPKNVKAIFSLVLKANDQHIKGQELDLAKRKMALLEKREADTKTTLTDQALTPEQKQERIRAIFGMT